MNKQQRAEMSATSADRPCLANAATPAHDDYHIRVPEYLQQQHTCPINILTEQTISKWVATESVVTLADRYYSDIRNSSTF